MVKWICSLLCLLAIEANSQNIISPWVISGQGGGGGGGGGVPTEDNSVATGYVQTVTQTMSLTVANQPNRVLWVWVNRTYSAVQLNPSVTFGGTPLDSIWCTGANETSATYFFQLINPSNTTANIVATVDSTNASLRTTATVWYNVNQSTPLSVIKDSIDQSGTSDNPTVTLASAADEVVIASAVSQYGWVSNGAGQTQHALDNSDGMAIVSSKVGAASVEIEHTISNTAGFWWMIAASIQPP